MQRSLARIQRGKTADVFVEVRFLQDSCMKYHWRHPAALTVWQRHQSMHQQSRATLLHFASVLQKEQDTA
jgi:hypothetical protein